MSDGFYVIVNKLALQVYNTIIGDKTVYEEKVQLSFI